MSTTEERPDPQVVWALINSHVVSRCIHVIADFGVADALDSEPASAEELAERTGLNADALARMLRLLSAHGLFAGQGEGYVHTPESRLLRSDHPYSLRSFARMIGTNSWNAFTELAHPARTGRPALGWQAMMEHFAEHPDEAALFNEAMVDKAAGVVPAVVQAYDFSPFATIVDVGGGRGHLLSAILERVPPGGRRPLRAASRHRRRRGCGFRPAPARRRRLLR